MDWIWFLSLFIKIQYILFISEKCQKLTLGNQQPTGSFEDVKTLYEAERESILKTTPLTYASVFPSKLQLQSVQHVLKVFNEKVVAGLKIQGSNETAAFIHGVLNWWNTVNVSSKGQDARFKDPYRWAGGQKSHVFGMIKFSCVLNFNIFGAYINYILYR